jgi:biopolymer transport protein ExbD
MARRGKSGPEEINAGSMADIAFLLLIFFLVTTTMDQDTGILRQLPPPVEDNVDTPPVKKKNVYEVLVNSSDQLLVEGEVMDIANLKDGAIDFFTNPGKSENLPELRLVTKAEVDANLAQAKAVLAANPKNSDAKSQVKKWENKALAIKFFGAYNELPSSAVVSLRNDRGTSYDMYIQVQNELQSAVNQLRDEISLKNFGKRYSELDANKEEDKERILAVRQVYPQRISEAEPIDVNAGN